MTQHVTVNVHRPRLQRIWRNDDGLMFITLGNGTLHGEVTVFATDEQWNAVIAGVENFRSAEHSELSCDDCSYIAVDVSDLYEHITKNHAAAVK